MEDIRQDFAPSYGQTDEFVSALEASTDEERYAILAMESLSGWMGGIKYYEAAEPGYKSAFTRDSLIAMSLRGDPAVLKSQIDFSAQHIGKSFTMLNGEEPGKAHHELPGVTNEKDLNTTYNACDTTAEFLRSIAALAERGDDDVLDKYSQEIQAAVGYISRHIDDRNLFIEDPRFSGDQESDGRLRRYALKVTYWKDSELNREGRREPNYPIVYTLAHFQNAFALGRIGAVLKNNTLIQIARDMKAAGLQHLRRTDHFITAMDNDGVIDSPCSDSLMALLYLTPPELPEGFVQSVENYMEQLKTVVGYRSGMPVVEGLDSYHMQVWTHEQALLNAAARRHGLVKAEAITRRVEPYFMPLHDVYPELINPVTLETDGNIKQLWSIGAYLYFQKPERSLL